ncbi:hypothetical protein V2J09_006924 [Rumex salicifolius]
MGNLLKEALKSICGVNRWSYAVFWKIGCQNPKLLIWEDCYYEVNPCPVLTKTENQGLTLDELDKCWLSPEAYLNQSEAHMAERVDLLIKKMMVNQVHVVGEGLVGRTAFIGNHQWIVSDYFNETIHPPEVVNEVQLQFTCGMQTVAVIPVIPHGVIQLGSSLTIMESTGFIHDVKNLILHLGCIPSALVSDNFIKDGSFEQSGIPFPQVVSSWHPYGDAKKFNYSTEINSPVQRNLFQASQLGNQASHSFSSKVHDNLKTTASTFHIHPQNMSSRNAEADSGHVRLSENNFLRAEIIPFKSDSVPNCEASYCINSGPNRAQSHLQSQNSEPYDNWTSCAAAGVPPNCSHPEVDIHQCIPVKNGEKDLYESFNIVLLNKRDHSPSSDFQADFTKVQNAIEVSSCETAQSDINSSVQGDLFDVLGWEFKNKILNGYSDRFSNPAGENIINQIKSQDLTSTEYPSTRTTGSGKLPASNSDHLLDAMVSGVHKAANQTSDDNVSCKTTLTNANSSLMFDQGSISQQMCEFFGSSKTLVRSSANGENLTVSSIVKSDIENCAQTSSFYGSENSSWVEKGPNAKHETSIATANSKKSSEVGKPTRKRLKPGENPRPRPKDRQMIQDRVKELREIVPNGGKCSIDALLERTIKHMLFLQSVTQHADKLKQTVESKIINKNGVLIPKEGFGGGATWAYEVGSQANVCPIVVEDLNAPRQLLVEMLCEKRGFFLEIADIIRGMGLTILKGVMETRHDKIWARFAVEANRDVTRMELLEQTGKNINSLKQEVSKVSNSANEAYAHSASVPGN